jgi:triosephosphate isomerase
LRTLILNFKNYEAAQGDGALMLARTAERVSKKVRARIIVAPPTPMLARVASKVGIQVFSQSVASAIG